MKDLVLVIAAAGIGYWLFIRTAAAAQTTQSQNVDNPTPANVAAGGQRLAAPGWTDGGGDIDPTGGGVGSDGGWNSPIDAAYRDPYWSFWYSPFAEMATEEPRSYRDEYTAPPGVVDGSAYN